MSAVLALMLALGSGTGPVTTEQSRLQVQLRAVTVHCGRAGYVLRPVGKRRLIVTALPYIRQTPLSEADLRCIRREVRKSGFTLSENGR